MARFALGVLCGVALGFLIGAFVMRPSPGRAVELSQAAAREESSAERADPGRSSSSARTPEREPIADPRERDVRETVGEEELLGAALLAFARRGIETGWGSVRSDAIPEPKIKQALAEFEELVRSAPERIGRELAERETRRERAAGNPLALLEMLDADGGGPLLELAGDPEAMDELLMRESPEHFVDPDARKLADQLSDGVTLEFPAGVFQIGNFLGDRLPFPRDVTLAGAGMNATLFVLRSNLGAREPLRRFAIRDCTVFTDGHYLFDHRYGGASLALDRVRVIGFDSGAGSSCAISIRGGVVMTARACRFEGGYGRSPGYGQVFRIDTQALVARFEACVLSNVRLNVSRFYTGATVVFSSCQLLDMLDDPLADALGQNGVVFPGSSVFTREAGTEPPRLDLNDLFPDWQQRMQR